MYILAPEIYILAPEMYILGPEIYILAPEMYILAPKIYKLAHKMYILVPKMDKSVPFEKVQPQWQLSYLFSESVSPFILITLLNHLVVEDTNSWVLQVEYLPNLVLKRQPFNSLWSSLQSASSGQKLQSAALKVHFVIMLN